jgi:hypothetical protein
MSQLNLDRVPADLRGGALFLATHGLHVGIRQRSVGAGARGAGAVGDDDAAERLAGKFEAIGDAGIGHDFDVVLVCGDAEMGDARQRVAR